jgi:hypothetical protein
MKDRHKPKREITIWKAFRRSLVKFHFPIITLSAISCYTSGNHLFHNQTAEMIQLFSRKVFVIIAIMAFILIAVIMVVSFLAKPFLHEKISETLLREIPEGFEFTYDSLEITLIPPGAYIYNARIASANSNEEGFLDIQIKHLWIDGFGLREYLMNDLISIKQIKADGVNLTGSGSLPSFKGELDDLQAFGLEIERIDISNGTLNYRSVVSGTGTNIIIPEWELTIEGFPGNTDNINYELEMTKPSYTPGNGLHILGAESISLSSRDSSMILNSFSVKPLIKAPQLAQFVKEETDIVDMEVLFCKINNLDVHK